MEFGISLGSNLGDRLAHLRAARGHIVALPGVREVACSPVYETEPVQVRPEHRDKPYLNAVMIVEAPPAPGVLADALHGIEAALGRVRSADRNAPRPIDLDVLYAGDRTSAAPALTLPHPRWAERRFVVQPLADVRPALRLPGHPETVAGLLLSLPPHPDVVLFSLDW